MTTTVVRKASVLELLRLYDHVAFRVVLRRPSDDGNWVVHTLVIDALPEPYTRDEAALRERYQLEKYAWTSPTAVFIAGVEKSSDIVSWFDQGSKFSITAPDEHGYEPRIFTAMMPELQDQAPCQTFYYRGTTYDGWDRMLWPHQVYSFYRITNLGEPVENERLVVSGGGRARSFPSFKRAVIELVYGEKDWTRAQNHSADPTIAVRVVEGQPFFANVQQLDERRVGVTVAGLKTLNTVIQLEGSGGVSAEARVLHPDTYEIHVEQGVPSSGRITLLRGTEVLDEYEWDDRYTPLAGAVAAPPSPLHSLVLTPREEVIFPLETAGLLASPLGAASMETSSYHNEDVPLAIRESLAHFSKDHPNSEKTGFIMMRFGSTQAHDTIAQTIKETLATHGLEAVRADDKEYHADTYQNIQTYMHGCGFGIAVFERLESDEYSSNVALEVGYMFALRKSVCLLKDKTLKTLHTDLVGKLYRPFDPQRIHETMPNEMSNWLRDHSLL